MNIKYQPKHHDPQKFSVSTNLGSFVPGEIRVVGTNDEREANRLVANGPDFVLTPERPNHRAAVEAWTLQRRKLLAKRSAPPPPREAAASGKPAVAN